MGKLIKIALAAVALLAGLLWTADWLLLRRKISTDADAFGEVIVHYRFAVHQRNRRIEQNSEKPRPVECVHSLFPHYDDAPCWYLEKHPEQMETLDGSPWHFFYQE
jgi:hypothetical protein